jgi:hypothetical protein
MPLSAPRLDLKSSDNGTDFAYGVGAQFRIWSLSLRGEYERFEVADTDKVDMLSGRDLDVPVRNYIWDIDNLSSFPFMDNAVIYFSLIVLRRWNFAQRSES